jgi:hypothetical protein
MPSSHNLKRCTVYSAFFWIVFFSVILTSISARAENDKPEDACQSVWSSLSELLRRREYGSASGLLESVADDPELQYKGKQIESDKEVINWLRMLQTIVTEQLSSMPEGTPIEISGITCTFVRNEKSPTGNNIILKSNSSDREMTKRIADLPPETWMHIAESRMDAFENPQLVLGVFVGFDRSADIKAARRFLDEAAGKGADVTIWLARLDQAENEKKAIVEESRSKNDDPLLGNWREVVGKGENQHFFNVEFRSGGVVLRALSRSTKKTRRRNLVPASNNIAGRGRWEMLAEGSYRITYGNGATGEITLAGDRYWGQTAGGLPMFGTRQLTGKK